MVWLFCLEEKIHIPLNLKKCVESVCNTLKTKPPRNPNRMYACSFKVMCFGNYSILSLIIHQLRFNFTLILIWAKIISLDHKLKRRKWRITYDVSKLSKGIVVYILLSLLNVSTVNLPKSFWGTVSLEKKKQNNS